MVTNFEDCTLELLPTQTPQTTPCLSIHDFPLQPKPHSSKGPHQTLQAVLRSAEWSESGRGPLSAGSCSPGVGVRLCARADDRLRLNRLNGRAVSQQTWDDVSK
ncbi:hypothetical protein SRHO_G00284780 [Serrasalmus rhombeus]